MNASASVTPPLVFSWAPPRRRARALVFFLIASFLLHAGCFYLFQIVYPTTVTLLPAPARLSVITPDDPASVSFLRWVEAEDPALATATMRPPETRPVAFPQLQYVPSFAQYRPSLKPMPESAPNLEIPSLFSATSARNATPPATVPAVSATRKTTALFSDSIGGQPLLPPFQWTANRGDTPANARVRIAVDPGGMLRYCFVEESSGDPGLDEQARRFLQLTRFPRREDSTDLTWATATLLWGNDLAARATATPAPSPTAAP